MSTVVAKRLGRVISAACILALLAVPDSWAENLSAIYRLARDNDPQLAGAREAAAAGRERAVQGRAQLLPAINATASGKRITESSTAFEGQRTYHAGSYSVAMVQPLWRAASVRAKEQGELQSQLAEK